MEKTVAEKLEALLTLQEIDSQLDEIYKMRGDLPREVQDLEDEIEGYKTRISRFEAMIKEWEAEIKELKQTKKECELRIEKYKNQQMNIRNNREYEAISREIESEELEIVLCDKKIKELSEKIKAKKEEIAEVQKIIDERSIDLENKRQELEQIMSESEEEEKNLKKNREKQIKQIEERLYTAYEKLRKNAGNGLAVVVVTRDACGGCFNQVPPQRQLEIKEKKKIIVCEHCGRILADVEEAEDTEAKPKRKARRLNKQ
jgi:predicted  nucleic acid-binding Zn-ribbon protein